MISTKLNGIKQAQAAIEKVPEVARKAASLTLNAAARKGAVWGKQEISTQVNLQKSYLNENLVVAKHSTPASLYAIIRGRARPTLLSRFVTNLNSLKASYKTSRRANVRRKSKRNKPRVKVKRSGSVKVMRSGFLVKGKSGNHLLVVRTKGGPPESAYRPARFGKSGKLWVLYGPSVDQVFDSTREEISPRIESFMGKEFHRQFKRLNK